VTDDPYVYPGASVLRNKLGITNEAQLEYHEREFAAARAAQGIPTGTFDLTHLRAIHRHLFQDIYEWAGEIRTVEISKGGSQFQFRRSIETGMADVHRRLKAANFLKGLTKVQFAEAAGKIIGDVNYVHPFREGNGRAQLYYLEQLAEQAGHPIDLGRLDPRRWIAASRAAHTADYRLMAEEIGRAILDRAPVCFIVHGLPHLRAALTAGAEFGRPIIALSGPSAGAYAGAGWFTELVRQGRAEFPEVQLTAIFDCGDRAGDALAAFDAGVTDIVFTGHPDAFTRLTAIAAGLGVRVHDRRPEGFDLINLKDPLFAARRHCGLSS
jgi:cell filamentation protein